MVYKTENVQNKLFDHKFSNDEEILLGPAAVSNLGTNS